MLTLSHYDDTKFIAWMPCCVALGVCVALTMSNLTPLPPQMNEEDGETNLADIITNLLVGLTLWD
jgi:hypothetical protein